MNKNPLFSATPVPGARFRNLHAASLGRLLTAIASLLIVSPSLCHAAQSCTLAWDASSDPGVAGYELRYGTSSGNPSQSIDVLKTTTFTVSNLNDATTYYFVVAAYDAAKVESQPSNEVSFTTPGSTLIPRDLPISIGETSILASPDSHNGSLLVAQQANLTQTATVQSLSFYITSASGKLRLGIFDATGPNGGPGTKKAETAEITPTVGWNKANVIAPVSLPQGIYWLAYLASDNNLAFVKNLSGQARYYTYSYGPMPATFSISPQSEVLHWSLFATLSTSGSQLPTYALTVIDGSGDGPYPAGAQVLVSADTPPAGQGFALWTNGDDTLASILNNPLNSTTTATMPSSDATIKATYKNAGPTISMGETSILASSDSNNGSLLVAQQANLTQTATVQSLSFYITSASGKLRLGIFDATGPNGGPGTKKAETAEITPTVGWNKANVIAPVSLPQGIYWLAYLASDNNLAFVKNLSGQARYYTYSYGPMPATFSTSPQSEVVHWSLFATLSTSGAQLP